MFACILSVFLIFLNSTNVTADTNDKVISYFEKMKQANAGIVSGKGSYSWTQILTEKTLARAYASIRKDIKPKPKVETKFNMIIPPDSTDKLPETSIDDLMLPEGARNLITNRYFTYAFDGSRKVSYEYNNQGHEVLLKKTELNGKMTKQIFYYVDSDGMVTTRGLITENIYEDHAIINPFYWTSEIIDTSLNHCKNGHFSTVLFNKADYNGLSCDVITLEYSERNVKYVLWISPELGYNCKKIEIIRLDKDNRKECVIEYSKYKDFYIPHNIVRMNYVNGEFASKHIITLNDDWEFNSAIGAEEFTVDFPIGTKVHDEVDNKKYIVE